MDPAIAFVGARRTFVGPDGSQTHAVRGLDLEIQAGETICLIGRSGCGKTTTLRMVNRLVEPTGGRVEVAGEDVTRTDVIALRRGIGYVIQSGGLFPHLSVAENVGLLCTRERWTATRTRDRVHELLELVGLPPGTFATRHPRALSGGQRQRVGIARALALDPPYLLMDEPFGALDPLTRRQIHRDLQGLEAWSSKTTLLVTHDMDEAFALGDRVALMDQGALLQVGTRQEFLTSPASETVAEFLAAELHGGGEHG